MKNSKNSPLTITESQRTRPSPLSKDWGSPLDVDILHRVSRTWQQWIQESTNLKFDSRALEKWLEDYFSALWPTKRPLDSQFQMNRLLRIFQENNPPPDDFFLLFFGLSNVLTNVCAEETNSDQMHTLLSMVQKDFSSHMSNFYRQAVINSNKESNRSATLLRVTKAANSSLELDKVLQAISDEIITALDALACNSYLFPDKLKYGQYYLLGGVPEGYDVPDPPELFGLDALQHGEPVFCYDAATDPRTDKKTVEFFNLKSLMAFPLISNGKTIAAGLIVMKDYHHFTQDEIDLVKAIANSAAMAVENARLYDSQIQLTIAQERNMLAQELHDRIAQNLAIVKLNLNAILLQKPEQPIKDIVDESKHLVDETYQELRDAILGLRCLPSSTLNSLEDVREYLTTYGAHHDLDIQFQVDERDFREINAEAVLQIGRIIDEAVVNSCKHSSADHVWISSGVDKNRFWVSVEDDGVGIDWEKLNHLQEDHFGIKIMKERAESAGGHLTIEDRETGGTRVILEIPLKR
jgi:signal transduction histidine kinase